MEADVRSLIVQPGTPATLYALTGGTDLYTSTDQAMSWIRIPNNLPRNGVMELAINPRAPFALYAITTSGVYRSKDGGRIWTPINAGLKTLFVRDIAFDPWQTDVLYVGTSSGVYKIGLST